MHHLSEQEQLFLAIQLYNWTYRYEDQFQKTNESRIGSCFFWSDTDEKFLQAVS